MKKIIINSLRLCLRKYSILKTIMLSFITGKPKVFYYQKLNFGDAFNQDLFNFYLKGHLVISSAKYSDIIGVGSLLHMIPKNYKGIIMGTGAINMNQDLIFSLKNANIFGLRGPLTRKEIGVDKGFMGDPGLMCTLIYEDLQVSVPKVEIGVVLHYVDDNLENRERIKQALDENIMFIRVEQEPKKVFQLISNCKKIYSSSLHGLIFADAIGIPNIHLKLGDRLIGGDFKFNDYFLSVNRDLVINRCNINSLREVNLKFNCNDNLASREIIEVKQSEIYNAFLKLAKFFR